MSICFCQAFDHFELVGHFGSFGQRGRRILRGYGAVFQAGTIEINKAGIQRIVRSSNQTLRC